jgi:hypothetical protein
MQGVGVGDMCVPTNANPVALWSNAAVVHAIVLWHVAQFAAANGAPDVECVGLLVCCQVVKWHPELPQSLG